MARLHGIYDYLLDFVLYCLDIFYLDLWSDCITYLSDQQQSDYTLVYVAEAEEKQ